MRESLRKSGIDIIGDMPWGTHFCQFYQTKEDLLEYSFLISKQAWKITSFACGLRHDL